ncbi:nuclear receptor subfamily 2 group E member 1 [Thrips palmi]|uniref:Nuclear receptor subfamily 2 group E member 1 n=1 Tax=Thrips palmi TaxID=161013 RepID=A0A6P8ZBI1_THRPL|nr:nuclear receptor subfamily 2 group E member 1 [Thrips palmi]
MQQVQSAPPPHLMDLRLHPHHQPPPQQQEKLTPTSSRILYDIPCKVCRDHSSGKHYGIFACDGCAGFFKRSIRRNRQYVCKAKSEGSCVVDKTHRNQCRACRLRKCVEAGMNRDAVQHERGPRNSTLRRQMALYLKDAMPHHGMPMLPLGPPMSPEPSSRSPPPPPPAVPSLPLPETVCEAAARLLFLNVQWARGVPAFTGLSLRDQLLLLQESWSELLVLAAAQFALPLGQDALRGHEDYRLVLQDTLAKFAALAVDAHEYSCLRAIVLFKTAVERGPLVDVPAVAALQDQAQLMLSKYTSAARPDQPCRFGKLLLLLPELRKVPANAIEDLFFRRTIGSIPIQGIICNMYSNSEP